MAEASVLCKLSCLLTTGSRTAYAFLWRMALGIKRLLGTHAVRNTAHVWQIRDLCLKSLYPGSDFLAAVNSRFGTWHPMLTLADMLCVKDFHRKERDSGQAFTNAFDGLLSRTDVPGSLSAHLTI